MVAGRPVIRVRVSAPGGSGKSTLLRMLSEHLMSLGIPVTMPARAKVRSAEDHRECIEALLRRGTIIEFREIDTEVTSD